MSYLEQTRRFLTAVESSHRETRSFCSIQGPKREVSALLSISSSDTKELTLQPGEYRPILPSPTGGNTPCLCRRSSCLLGSVSIDQCVVSTQLEQAMRKVARYDKIR